MTDPPDQSPTSVATDNPDKQAIQTTDHLFRKNSADGTFTCMIHQRPAQECVPTTPNVVWENTLDDGEYAASVTRIEPYRGTLMVAHKSGRIVLRSNVGLAYDAPFGADIMDVDRWEQAIVAVVDRDYRRRGIKPPAGKTTS